MARFSLVCHPYTRGVFSLIQPHLSLLLPLCSRAAPGEWGSRWVTALRCPAPVVVGELGVPVGDSPAGAWPCGGGWLLCPGRGGHRQRSRLATATLAISCFMCSCGLSRQRTELQASWCPTALRDVTATAAALLVPPCRTLADKPKYINTAPPHGGSARVLPVVFRS